MAIVDTLMVLKDIAQAENLSPPYMVGGFVRDILLVQNDKSLSKHKIKDIDITTGDEDIHELSIKFAQRLGGDLLELDGHNEVKYRGLKFDFSKNVNYPNIDEWLNHIGIEYPTGLQRETFSRDFTINSLLMTPDFKRILDFTGRGRTDIESRILTCPLSCLLSVRFDPRRILRAYLFRARYKFSFSDELREAIRESLSYLERVNRRYSSEMVNKILREDERLLEELIADGILQRLPMTKYVRSLLIKHRKLLEVL